MSEVMGGLARHFIFTNPSIDMIKIFSPYKSYGKIIV